MPFRSILMFAVVAWITLGAVVGVRAEDQKPADPKSQAYRLRVGDDVAISVLPRKEYDCGGTILPDGTVSLRNAGEVKAEGMTLTQLSDHVFGVLSKKLRNPRVYATLTRMAPTEKPDVAPPAVGRITLVGAVGKPGAMELEQGLRLRKALDLAGGSAADADLSNIIVFHQDLTRTVVDLSTADRVQDPAHNLVLKDGDSVEVPRLPERPKATGSVRITGQVANPGQVELKYGMALEDLIVAAGKLAPLADVERIQFQRRGEPIREINLIEQQKLGLKGKIPLAEGDEVFVPEYKDRVLLIGIVAEPGAKAVTPGESVRDFFLRGKPEMIAALNPASVDLKHVELIRVGKPTQKLDLGQVLKRAEYKDNVALASGDVLYLPPREQKTKKSPLDFLQNLGPLGLLMGLF